MLVVQLVTLRIRRPTQLMPCSRHLLNLPLGHLLLEVVLDDAFVESREILIVRIQRDWQRQLLPQEPFALLHQRWA